MPQLNRRAVLAATIGSILAPEAAATRTVSASVGIDVGGVRRHETLAEALVAAHASNADSFPIAIGPGRHLEKLIIDRPGVELVGAGANRTILSFGAAAGMPGPDGQPWGTWGCATLTVRAPRFAAFDLTIENSFDYIADLAAPQFERVGANGAQAVALMLDRGSDCAAFHSVAITGHQDTLFVDAGRASFRNCAISGSVDFIFGGGRAYFEACELRSRYRPLMQRNHGWVAVPSTPREQPFGLVFHRCRLTREAQVPPASVALGRPWRPTRSLEDGRYGDPDALGQASFLRCWMDDHISADGWDEMGYQARDGTRVFFSPLDARLAEFASTGPGAFVNRRRPQLTAPAARAMTEDAVLGGWRPPTPEI